MIKLNLYPYAFNVTWFQVIASYVENESFTYIITPPWRSPVLSLRSGGLKSGINRSLSVCQSEAMFLKMLECQILIAQ